MAKKNNLSRYEQIKIILNEAQGDQCPDYDGYHRFWELPHSEFLNTVLYGVKMIVLDATENSAQNTINSDADTSSSCCPHMPESVEESKEDSDCCHASADISVSGNSRASGLIKGLKGQFPFDGTQFPRLLWGTDNVVSAQNVQFIADWIDDGCPETDQIKDIEKTKQHNLSWGSETHDVTGGVTNQARRNNGHLVQRKNLEEVTPQELDRYRAAIKTMQARPEIDRRSFKYFARVHGNSCQHGWEKFLPWHRCLMYNFEQELLDIDDSVALHYWLWSDEIYLDIDKENYHIPEAYQLWITDEAIEALEKTNFPSELANELKKVAGENNKFQTLDDLCYKAFYKSQGDNYYSVIKNWKQQFFDLLKDTNPLWHPFRYPMKTSYKPGRYKIPLKTLRDFNHHYPTGKDVKQILSTNTFAQFGGGDAYNESFGVLDMDPHNTIHIWSGGFNPNFDENANDPLEPVYGDMLNNLTTGFDPIFYAHHTNVDRLWYRWQQKHPNMNPDNGSSVLTPFNFLVNETYNVRKFGYEYVRSGHYIQGNSGLQLNKFKSGKVGVSKTSLKNHNKVEVKIINVVQPNQSLIVKVFINLKNPEPEDRDKFADNYVGSFVLFGHGQCIGTEGHCDPPVTNKRKGDIRERHHNAPWNYKINATECITKLKAKGETDFHVNLLVQGTDGIKLKDTLRLEAVSLDFID